MKIGIHHTKGYYSDRWLTYCDYKGIDYKLVDCLATDIIEQLSDCDALMWHFNHKSAKASKFAKELLYSVQASGKKVFPDFHSVWHFDDKLGQKYLFEATGIPHAPSYAFYSKKEALSWAAETTYPKVFKLRNGSSSSNVKLVKTRRHAVRLIRKAFGRGYKQYYGWNSLKERLRKFRMGKAPFYEVIKGVLRLFRPPAYARLTGREKGYIYFQDYIPDMDHDIRVYLVGDKAYAKKRLVRKNDFRASGSMDYLYEREHVREEAVKLAFEISEKLKVQSLVYDFVFLDGKPLLLEISYGTLMDAFESCVGYWDREMNWHDGQFDLCGSIVENLIDSAAK